METSTRPPADWYPDPAGDHELRFWDGERWTAGVSDGGTVTEAELDPAGAAAAWDRVTDRRAAWPAWVALLAIVGTVAGMGAAALAAAVVDGIGGGRLPVLAAGLLGLYGTLLATCALVGRRLGSERGLVSDFGLRSTKLDIARGLLLGVVARVAAALAALAVVVVHGAFDGTNLPTEDELGGDLGLAIGFVVAALLLAPVVEELYFRGLLQRALESALPPWAAIAVASALFGLAHVSIELGAASGALVAATAAAGAVFGVAARRYRRLGPAMWAHAWFNLAPALLVFTLL